jgi:hypothetical protein
VILKKIFNNENLKYFVIKYYFENNSYNFNIEDYLINLKIKDYLIDKNFLESKNDSNFSMIKDLAEFATFIKIPPASDNDIFNDYYVKSFYLFNKKLLFGSDIICDFLNFLIKYNKDFLASSIDTLYK